MDPSGSPLQSSAQETLAALREIRRHDELLSGSWRQLLDTTRRRLKGLGDGRSSHLPLRTARAAAATAAGEAAQAARFQARLLKLAPEDLGGARARLEARIDVVRHAQAEAAGHLNAGVDGLLDELRERISRDGTVAAGVTRHQLRLADDLVRAMRAYADRVEQILFDLGDTVHAEFGLSLGAAMPTRVSAQPPRPDLERIAIDDAARLEAELADAVWRLVEHYRERLDERVDDAIRALRSSLDRAAEHQRRGEEHAREQVGELMRQAQRLDAIAEGLDWMLPADLSASGRA